MYTFGPANWVLAKALCLKVRLFIMLYFLWSKFYVVFMNLKLFINHLEDWFSLKKFFFLQEYVMSVVVGDDLVPRLSIAAIYNLREKITNVLHACKKPKVLIPFQIRFKQHCV